MFNHSFFDNSRPQGTGWMEIISSLRGLLLRDPKFVPLRRSELEGVVWGPLAALRLTQVFAFESGQCDQVVEAVYRFPLPGDAAITGVVVHYGDARIRAQLAERGQARREYDSARSHGKAAALLCKEGLSVFTLHVSGIQPDQEVRVTTDLVALAQAEGSGWQMRFPLTVAPRFSRQDEKNLPQTDAKPVLVAHDPGHTFGMQVIFAGNMIVESPTHPIKLEAVQDGWIVGLPSSGLIPDRDIVLRWKPYQVAERPVMQVLTSASAGTGCDFLALIIPPVITSQVKPLPREVIVLVDHSGSMDGSKREAADWTVRRFIGGLDAVDHFNLGVFDDGIRWFNPCLLSGSSTNTGAAMGFLDAQRDGGGTNLGVALEQAAKMKAVHKEAARHILIITDAQVTDENRLIQLAERCYGGGVGSRVSLICIDSAPNDFLARSIASAGGGVARFVSADPQEGDIATALDEILNDWQAPLCRALRLTINQADVVIAGRDSMTRRPILSGDAIDLGDLPAGRSLWIAGKIAEPAGSMIFTLTSDQDPSIAVLTVDQGNLLQGNPAIGSLVSAWRLMALEHLNRSTYVPEEILARLKTMGVDVKPQDSGGDLLYPENRANYSRSMVKDILVTESLSSGLLCMETAWLAIREEKGQEVQVRVEIANALPAGWNALTQLCGIDLGPTMDVDLNMGGNSIFDRFKSGVSSILGGSGSFDLDVPCFMPARSRNTSGSRSRVISIYQGSPQIQARQRLYTSLDDDMDAVDATWYINRLELETSGDVSAFDLMELWIYIDDLHQPMARVRITELIRQGGQRPLSLVKPAFCELQVFLVMPNAAEEPSGEEIPFTSIRLHCR